MSEVEQTEGAAEADKTEDQGKRVIALVSGGLDSAVMLDRLARRCAEVVPVYVESGLYWEPVEIHWFKRFMATLSHESLTFPVYLECPARRLYGTHWSVTGESVPDGRTPAEAVHLPGRNPLLVTTAGVYALRKEIDTIAVGSLSGNPFPDASDAFFARMIVCPIYKVQHGR